MALAPGPCTWKALKGCLTLGSWPVTLSGTVVPGTSFKRPQCKPQTPTQASHAPRHLLVSNRFQTFGSSLGKPGALTSASTLPASWATGSSTVTPVGCPVDILSAVEVFASQRRFESIFATPTTSVKILEDALQLIRSYDMPAWAKRTGETNPAVPCEDLLHLGNIWKLAADMYACSVLCSSTEGATIVLPPPSVHALRAEYKFFERKSDGIMKCLIWPTFVAGAASTSPQDRAWAARTLDRIWNLGHCANTTNATRILETLWEKHDRIQVVADDYRRWDWISELSQLKGSWLFV